MKNEILSSNFNEAVQFVNDYEGQLPADIMLKLYAFYKIANRNKIHPDNKTSLIDAFKANALFQTKDLSQRDAMEAYIGLVKSLQ